jgi:hypothetical protein
MKRRHIKNCPLIPKNDSLAFILSEASSTLEMTVSFLTSNQSEKLKELFSVWYDQKKKNFVVQSEHYGNIPQVEKLTKDELIKLGTELIDFANYMEKPN